MTKSIITSTNIREACIIGKEEYGQLYLMYCN